MRVAFQGERGAFSETAARRLTGPASALQPCPTFEEMFEAVTEGGADCCVAPIENSLAGSIHRNYDLLLSSALTIAGETNVRVVHNVIGAPGAELAAIRRIYSHPVALAQCTRFLRQNRHIDAVPAHDTAGAVRLVLESGRADEAAIASSHAAELYGGAILARAVEDNPQNFTRFLLLTRDDAPVTPDGETRRWKTTMVIRLPNRPGSLYRALGAFAMFELDLSKIESRPVEGKPWEYAFYIDVIGKRGEPPLDRALDNLAHLAEEVRVLGSYPTRW